VNHGICACGCGQKIKANKWHKYRNVKYVSGHNIRTTNPLSLLDKTKDNRKNQTGFLAPKTIGKIKHDAIKAGYEWMLDDVFAFNLIISNCSYCGKESGWPNGRNGIDRINSSIDYYPENCIACCKFCNRAKSDRTVEEFKSWAVDLYLNISKEEGKDG
jgi:hypothetical protein